MKNIFYKIFISTLSVIIFTTLFVNCGGKEEEKDEEKTGATVKVLNPHTTGMVDYLQLNATTTFLKKEIVRATFQGFIQTVSKNIGDVIKEGDELFSLKTKEANAIGDASKNLISIKAKSSGVLTKILFHAGDYISEGEQLAEVANPNSLVVELNVPYQDNGKVKIGMQCKLFLQDGKVLNGTISKSLPSMDATSQTQTYLIDCSLADKLPENLNLVAKIPVRSINDATVLPKSSVLSNEALTEFWIMKLTDDKTAIKVPVKKGIENDSLVQIIEPRLNSTDKIIFDGGYGLPDTAKVSVER